MCDTIVRVEPGRVLFAKNSDRDPNEAQLIEWHPRREYPEGATLQCTWIRVPQVRETYAVLLSRPFWMWGAEMGANEHGVVIGNEAVFTNQPYVKSGLTGMDLLRLALERAVSAEEACHTIQDLLAKHGQGGGCGHENRSFTYHNSFLIADASGAFVLETAGKQVAIEKVQGARSISNGLTIPGFRERYAKPLHGAVAGCVLRQTRTQSLGGRAGGLGDMMAILRDYGEGRTAPHYSWINGGMGAPCMHAGGLIAASQTTASWVADLRPGGVSHWVTATSLPSLSLFKPVAVEQPVSLGASPTDHADRASLWWKHERLCRSVFRNPSAHLKALTGERDDLEREWLANPPGTEEAFAAHHALLDRWLAMVSEEGVDVRPWYVRRYWRRRNRMAGLC